MQDRDELFRNVLMGGRPLTRGRLSIDDARHQHDPAHEDLRTYALEKHTQAIRDEYTDEQLAEIAALLDLPVADIVPHMAECRLEQALAEGASE
jgi:hypothetical protein